MTATVDEKTAETIRERVGKMDLRDHILAWDRKQGLDSPDARMCQWNPAHGRLQVHGSGHLILCGVQRPSACQYQEPISQ